MRIGSPLSPLSVYGPAKQRCSHCAHPFAGRCAIVQRPSWRAVGASRYPALVGMRTQAIAAPVDVDDGRTRDFVQSLERGLAVITSFSRERPAQTLSEVAAA